jgi:hypothetical protein
MRRRRRYSSLGRFQEHEPRPHLESPVSFRQVRWAAQHVLRHRLRPSDLMCVPADLNMDSPGNTCTLAPSSRKTRKRSAGSSVLATRVLVVVEAWRKTGRLRDLQTASEVGIETRGHFLGMLLSVSATRHCCDRNVLSRPRSGIGHCSSEELILARQGHGRSRRIGNQDSECSDSEIFHWSLLTAREPAEHIRPTSRIPRQALQVATYIWKSNRWY